jgi:hypothetical protein
MKLEKVTNKAERKVRLKNYIGGLLAGTILSVLLVNLVSMYWITPLTLYVTAGGFICIYTKRYACKQGQAFTAYDWLRQLYWAFWWPYYLWIDRKKKG